MSRLPIVGMAVHPVHIAEALYLHEPSGDGKGPERKRREATIGRIVAKLPAGRPRAAASFALTMSTMESKHRRANKTQTKGVERAGMERSITRSAKRTEQWATRTHGRT